MKTIEAMKEIAGKLSFQNNNLYIDLGLENILPIELASQDQEVLQKDIPKGKKDFIEFNIDTEPNTFVTIFEKLKTESTKSWKWIQEKMAKDEVFQVRFKEIKYNKKNAPSGYIVEAAECIFPFFLPNKECINSQKSILTEGKEIDVKIIDLKKDSLSPVVSCLQIGISIEDIKNKIGQKVKVFIKSVVPDRGIFVEYLSFQGLIQKKHTLYNTTQQFTEHYEPLVNTWIDAYIYFVNGMQQIYFSISAIPYTLDPVLSPTPLKPSDEVTGQIVGINSHGITVIVQNQVCFCGTYTLPASIQENCSVYFILGHTYKFKVNKIDDHLNRIYLIQQEYAFDQNYTIGDEVMCQTRNQMPYGIFVSFNNMNGLLHKNEIPEILFNHKEFLFPQNTKIKLQIIDIKKNESSEQADKISYSLLKYEQKILNQIQPGETFQAEITAITDQYMFVVYNHVWGWLPANEFTWKFSQIPAPIFQTGTKIEVRAIQIIPENGIFILSPARSLVNPWNQIRLESGDKVIAKVVEEKESEYLLLAYNDLIGILPDNEINDKSHPYSLGEEIEVMVKDYQPFSCILEFVANYPNLDTTPITLTNQEITAVKIEKQLNSKTCIVSHSGKMGKLTIHDTEKYPDNILALNSMSNSEIQVQIAHVDLESNTFEADCSIKALLPEEYHELYYGSIIETTITNVISEGLEVTYKNFKGFIPHKELEWNKFFIPNYQANSQLQAILIDHPIEEYDLCLSVRQMTSDPWNTIDLKKEEIVEVEIRAIGDKILVEYQQFRGIVDIQYMSWKTDLNAKREFFIGQKIKAKVLAIHQHSRILEFSFKDATNDPWENLDIKIGDKCSVRIIYCFNDKIEVDYKGVRGYIYKPNFSWNENNISGLLSAGTNIEVVTSYLDETKHEIIFDRKQLIQNPWVSFPYHENEIVEAKIIKVYKNKILIEIAGIWVELDYNNSLLAARSKEEFDLIHLLHTDEIIEVKIDKIDREQHQLSILAPVSQLDYSVGDKLVVKIIEVNKEGISVGTFDQQNGFIPYNEIAWNMCEYVFSQFMPNKYLSVKIISIDSENKNLILSRKLLFENEWFNIKTEPGQVIEVDIMKQASEYLLVKYNNIFIEMNYKTDFTTTEFAVPAEVITLLYKEKKTLFAKVIEFDPQQPILRLHWYLPDISLKINTICLVQPVVQKDDKLYFEYLNTYGYTEYAQEIALKSQFLLRFTGLDTISGLSQWSPDHLQDYLPISIGSIIHPTLLAIEENSLKLNWTPLPFICFFLPIGDIEWEANSANTEQFTIGDKIQVMVVSIDFTGHLVQVNRKYLRPDKRDFQSLTVGDNCKVTIQSIYSDHLVVAGPDYKGIIPQKEWEWSTLECPYLYSNGEQIITQILETDTENHQMLLSKRLVSPDPWLSCFIKQGEIIFGKIKKICAHILIIEYQGILSAIDQTELSWQPLYDIESIYHSGDKIQLVVKEINSNNRTLLLGCKELQPNPFNSSLPFQINDFIEVTIKQIYPAALITTTVQNLECWIEGEDLGTHILPNLTSVYSPGEKLNVQVKTIDTSTYTIHCSLGKLKKENSTPEDFRLGDLYFINVVSADSNGVYTEYNGYRGFIPKEEIFFEAKKFIPYLFEPGYKTQVCLQNIDLASQQLIFSSKKALCQSEYYQEWTIGKQLEVKILAKQDNGLYVAYKEIAAFIPKSEIICKTIPDIKKFNGKKTTNVIIKNIDLTIPAFSFSIKDYYSSDAKSDLADINQIDNAIVTKVENKGIYVNCRNTTCFIPNCELEWNNFDSARTLYQIGDKLQVKILNTKYLQNKKKKYTLSVKAITVDPWLNIKIKENDIIEASICQINNSTLFFDYQGMWGKISSDDIFWCTGIEPAAFYAINDQIQLKIIQLNPEQRILTGNIKVLNPDPFENIGYTEGENAEVKIKSISKKSIHVVFGGFVTKIPISELEWCYNIHTLQNYSPGDCIQAKITSISEADHTIALSVKALHPNPFEIYKQDEIIPVCIDSSYENGFIVHSDLCKGYLPQKEISWQVLYSREKFFRPGDIISAKIIDIDPIKPQILFSYRQTIPDPYPLISIGDELEVIVEQIRPFEMIVEYNTLKMILPFQKSGEQKYKKICPYLPGEQLKVKVTNKEDRNRKIQVDLNIIDSDELAFTTGTIIPVFPVFRKDTKVIVTLENQMRTCIDLNKFTWEYIPEENYSSLKLDATITAINTESGEIQLNLREGVNIPALLNANIGKILNGKIIYDTGENIYVEVSGYTCYTPFQEISWKMLRGNLRKKYEPGEQIRGVLQSITPDNIAIFSPKSTISNPFFSYKRGDVIKGIVRIQTQNGFIIELENATAYIRSSNLSWNRLNNWKTFFKINQEATFEIVQIFHNEVHSSIYLSHLEKLSFSVDDLVIGHIKEKNGKEIITEVNGIEVSIDIHDPSLTLFDTALGKRVIRPGENIKIKITQINYRTVNIKGTIIERI